MTAGLWESHVFVSYRGPDFEAARALTAGLQGVGLRAWWDMDPGDSDQAPRMQSDVRGEAIPGDDAAIESELAHAIAASMIAAVITSSHTRASFWVRKEIELAHRFRTPLLFWHLVEASPEREFLPSAESVELMRELHDRTRLNVVGHLILPLSEVAQVCGELESLVELGELVLHRGDAITNESLERVRPEYESLTAKARELRTAIYERYGQQVDAGRAPVAHAFRLKRPFVRSRVRHLERLLADETFRRSQLARTRQSR